MREIDEFPDDEPHIEERGIKVRDSKERTLTTEERDEIIRKYNDEIEKIESSEKSVTDSGDSGGVCEDANPSSGKRNIDPEEVCRLYLEDKLTLKKIGEHYGYKTGKSIKRILEAAGVEIRSGGFQEIEIDPEEAYRLYFDEKWDLKDVAAHFDCKSTDPILRVFKENEWKTRQQVSYQKEIDPEEVFRLYNEEGLNHRKIGELFGVSDGPIRRIFKEHDVPYGQVIPVDPEELHYFYFELGLSKEKTCEALGISKKPFDRILVEQGWDTRSAGFQPVEIDIDDVSQLYFDEELTLKETALRLGISTRTLTRYFENHNLEKRTLPKVEVDPDELSELYYDERLTLKEIAEQFELSKHTLARIIRDFELEVRNVRSVRELRDDIFGPECVLCEDPYKVIHRKDGTPHESHVLWTRKSLLNLEPNEWAALCEPCHWSTHALMKAYNFEWTQIEKMIKDNTKNSDS